MQHSAFHPVAPLNAYEIDRWAKTFGMERQAAERRFYALTVIAAIASDPVLSRRYVLRGSSAIFLRYASERTPNDVDFIDLERPYGAVLDEPREALDARIRRCLSEYFMRIFPGDDRVEHVRRAQGLVPVEVCRVYMPFRAVDHLMPGSSTLTVLVVELEYQIAEKICAVADQTGPRRFRPRDAEDIRAMVLRWQSTLDRVRISTFIKTRHAVQGGPVVSSALFEGSLKRRMAERHRDQRSGRWAEDWEWLVDFVRSLDM